MNEFRSTNPRVGDQISLSALERLTELAAVANSPYSSGPGYYGVTGQVVGSMADVGISTGGEDGTFLASYVPGAFAAANYPGTAIAMAFTAVASNGITILGDNGLWAESDGVGGIIVDILPATPVNPGVMSTRNQQFAGIKEFQNNVVLDSFGVWIGAQPTGSNYSCVSGFVNPPTGLGAVDPTAFSLANAPQPGDLSYTPAAGIRILLDYFNSFILFDSDNYPGYKIIVRASDGTYKTALSGTMIDGTVFTKGLLTSEGLLFTATRPLVLGSRGGNAALASLLTALAGMGLIQNGTVV